MASFTITVSAASARILLAASPSASVEATARGELATEWLKITAVPLLVFLIGAGLWSCIKKSSAWRILTDDGGSAHTEAADSTSRPTDSNHVVVDLEAGLELQLSQGCGRVEDLSVDSSKGSATEPPNTCEITSENGDERPGAN